MNAPADELPPLFLCERRPGNLMLTAYTCAQQHKAAHGAVDEAKVRLWECRDCAVGAANLAATPTAPPQRRDQIGRASCRERV